MRKGNRKILLDNSKGKGKLIAFKKGFKKLSESNNLQ